MSHFYLLSSIIVQLICIIILFKIYYLLNLNLKQKRFCVQKTNFSEFVTEQKYVLREKGNENLNVVLSV